MRRFAWTLAAFVTLSSAALADCESEVMEAVVKLRAAGSFHFVTQEWNRNFVRQTAGRVIPGKAKHVTSTMSNGSPGGEAIYIGKQSWKQDSLGWAGPWGTVWSDNDLTLKADLKIVAGSCSAIHGSAGSRLKEYKLSIEPDFRTDPTPRAVSILVDMESGVVVRFERLASPPQGISLVVTYRPDPTIRIGPPVVDPERRKANALAAFNREVELTDPTCRAAVTKLLQAGREGEPFQYKIEGGLWAGVSGMHGTFVPPHSLHNHVEGTSLHGGGVEYIVIGADKWVQGPPDILSKGGSAREWKKTANASPLSGAASASWMGSLFFDDFLTGSVSHVGRAQCPSTGGEAGDKIDFYEYDLYRDTPGGRLRVATQRLYADGTRPVKVETIGAQGRVTQVQTRTYIPGLAIDTPPMAAK